MKLAFHSKKMGCVSYRWDPRLGKRKPNAEIKAAFRSKNARFAFDRKDKKTWFRIDLVGQALNAVWRASLH